MDTAEENMIYTRALAYMQLQEEELNPFAHSLDTFSRTEPWIPKARLREFVVIMDPHQWNVTRENVRNALGVELKMDHPPLHCRYECAMLVMNRLSSWNVTACNAVVDVLHDRNQLDFELYEYASELVREQHEFYREVPARGEFLYHTPAISSGS